MTALLDAGVNVVRINASHATPEIRADWITRLQAIIDGRTESSAILLDLQGPRIRVGHLDEPLHFEPGQRVLFAPESDARPGEIPTTYEGLAADVHVGARILLDDGLLSVEVTGVRGDGDERRGVLKRVPVVLGIDDGKEVEIREGLKGDELIVARVTGVMRADEAVLAVSDREALGDR